MRMLAATLVAAALAFPPAGAVAAQPPTGRPCRFMAARVPAVAEDPWTGYLAGGPVAAVDSTATLTCELRVSGDVVVSASSAPGAVAVVEPRVVSYGAAEWEPIELCSGATVGGTTWSWDDGNGWAAGSHHCAPARTTSGLLDCFPMWGVLCLLPDDVDDLEPPPGTREFVLYVGCTLGPLTYDCSNYLVAGVHDLIVTFVDPPLCIVLAAAAPGPPGPVSIREDGDVYVNGEFFWDCPPYKEPV